jgi:hypothetical protein
MPTIDIGTGSRPDPVELATVYLVTVIRSADGRSVVEVWAAGSGCHLLEGEDAGRFIAQHGELVSCRG